MVFIGPESSRSKISRAQKISRARTQGRNSEYFPVNVSGNEIGASLNDVHCISFCAIFNRGLQDI